MAHLKCEKHGRRVFVTENGVTHRGGRRLQKCDDAEGHVTIAGYKFFAPEIVQGGTEMFRIGKDISKARVRGGTEKSYSGGLEKLRKAVTSDSPTTEEALARRVNTKKRPPRPEFTPWQNRPARVSD